MTEATNDTRGPTVTVNPASSTIEVDDLDGFVKIISAWHADQVERVKYLGTVPEGVTFKVGEKEVVLAGDTLTGFKFGLDMALMSLGTLPFVVELEEAPPEEQPAATAAGG